MGSLRYPIVRHVVHSPYTDILAVSIILIVSLALGYHKTFYFHSAPMFHVDINQWGGLIRQGAFPLGLFSTVVACFSMMSTRFTSKQSNWGNIIGIGTAVCVCIVDFLLGNKSALVTYPVTFFLSIFSTYKWARGEQIRNQDWLYYVLIIAGLILGYILVFLGFYIFDRDYGWYNSLSSKILFHSISITFGLSLGANSANAFKYQETWISWTIYNCLQITKNILLSNWANIGKYIFYFINAAFTYIDWRFNRDI